MIDSGRLERALHLVVEPHPAGGWLVTGGAAPHRVTVIERDGARRLRCDCAAFEFRGGPCKHQVAIRLHRLGPELVTALRELVTSRAAA